MSKAVDFVRDVRSEARKVTWPSRKETLVTAGMVFVMVALASLFLFVVDQVIGTIVHRVLDMAG